MDEFFPKAECLLGEGLWGRVYDLGDGAVLKLAREHCAGIGNGRNKIRREFDALTRLASVAGLGGLVPKALATGEVLPSSRLAAEGFAVWLQMEKIEGSRRSIPVIENAAPLHRRKIGESIGGTLAHLHRAFGGLNRDDSWLDSHDAYADIRTEVAGEIFFLNAIAALELERDKIPPDSFQVCHNDYNISNLMFSDCEVCGILDFAEWGIGYPEKDISDIINEISDLEDPVIRAYEQASGVKLDPGRLALGIAENGLYGAVISRREGDAVAARREQNRLARQLEKLGYGLTIR